MIRRLHGTPIIDGQELTIMVGGVGYGVKVTAFTLQQLATQTEAHLHIYTHVREDALELFGFMEAAERQLFLLLLDVSGVGPKTALGIMNAPTHRIIDAVQQAETSFFASVPRVGKKLAQKIIIDLRTKLGALKELQLGPLTPQRQEVMDALMGLGFSESSIDQVMRDLPIEEMDVRTAVKQALQQMGKGKLEAHSKHD